MRKISTWTVFPQGDDSWVSVGPWRRHHRTTVTRVSPIIDNFLILKLLLRSQINSKDFFFLVCIHTTQVEISLLRAFWCWCIQAALRHGSEELENCCPDSWVLLVRTSINDRNLYWYRLVRMNYWVRSIIVYTRQDSLGILFDSHLNHLPTRSWLNHHLVVLILFRGLVWYTDIDILLE